MTTIVKRTEKEPILVIERISADELIQKEWDDRAKTQDLIRKKLRSGWRNNDDVLDEFFQACLTNWKNYSGGYYYHYCYYRHHCFCCYYIIIILIIIIKIITAIVITIIIIIILIINLSY